MSEKQSVATLVKDSVEESNIRNITSLFGRAKKVN
jgi:hypothetical protein